MPSSNFSYLIANNLKKIIILFLNFFFIILVVSLLLKSFTFIPKIFSNFQNLRESNIYSVTDYLNPFIDNIEKNISNDNLYSYIYVDEIDEEGYLSYNRVKYLLTPNQMYDFNNSVVAFYNLNDNQLLDYLNSIKVDYIFIRRSKRLANLLKINIPEDGVVYKKNNIKYIVRHINREEKENIYLNTFFII
jgi:hypothetical protein